MGDSRWQRAAGHASERVWEQAFGFPPQFSNNLEEAIAREISYSHSFGRA